MFEFSLRSGSSIRPASPISLNAQIRVEQLEDRVVANAAPVIDSFFISQHLPNRQVVVMGHVTDDSTQVTVNFTGVATGTVMVDGLGNFTATLTATQLGQITAVATDNGAGDNTRFMPSSPLSSAPATVTLTNVAPVIQNFTATQGTNNVWTFTGRVVDEAASGLTVTLTSGMPSLSRLTTTVAADGTFTIVVQLNDPLDCGTVCADVTDWWGVAASQVSTVV